MARVRVRRLKLLPSKTTSTPTLARLQCQADRHVVIDADTETDIQSIVVPITASGVAGISGAVSVAALAAIENQGVATTAFKA